MAFQPSFLHGPSREIRFSRYRQRHWYGIVKKKFIQIIIFSGNSGFISRQGIYNKGAKVKTIAKVQYPLSQTCQILPPGTEKVLKRL